MEKGILGVTSKNFFKNTVAVFEQCGRMTCSADYVSVSSRGRVSSRYWYTEEGVYRESSHWGRNVATCDWYLNTLPITGLQTTKKKTGFCRWKDFKRKD